MRLIVDSNIILSCLIKNGLTKKIITSENFTFYTIDYVFEEVNKYKDLILKKTKLNEKELNILKNLIFENINIIPEDKVKIHFKKAYKIMKKIDPKDSPILACAFSVSNDGIWSEDKHFDSQDIIKIWKTKKLLDYL